jgi:acetylornithine/succinyldiaminopimelate/putrescine aminotransferase
VVRLQPPLILTEDEAAEVIDKLTAILRELDRSL